MLSFIDSLIKVICIISFAYGLYLVVSQYILRPFHISLNVSNAIKRLSRPKERAIKNPVLIHLSRLLKTVFKWGNDYIVYPFIAFSLLLAITVFVVIYNSMSLTFSLFISIFIGLLPYLYLRLRLRIIRIEGSYEGEGLVISIINNYKKYNFNMLEAIDKTAASNDIGEYSNRALYKLSISIKSARNSKEIEKAIKDFIYYFNTEWSIMLGMNFKIALVEGDNVYAALNDILSELRYVRDNIEAHQRNNSQAYRMIKRLFIPMYFFTVYLSINLFGFTLDKFIEYQVYNPLGRRLGILTLLSIIISNLIVTFSSRPKYDI